MTDCYSTRGSRPKRLDPDRPAAGTEQEPVPAARTQAANLTPTTLADLMWLADRCETTFGARKGVGLTPESLYLTRRRPILAWQFEPTRAMGAVLAGGSSGGRFGVAWTEIVVAQCNSVSGQRRSMVRSVYLNGQVPLPNCPSATNSASCWRARLPLVGLRRRGYAAGRGSAAYRLTRGLATARLIQCRQRNRRNRRH